MARACSTFGRCSLLLRQGCWYDLHYIHKRSPKKWHFSQIHYNTLKIITTTFEALSYLSGIGFVCSTFTLGPSVGFVTPQSNIKTFDGSQWWMESSTLHVFTMNAWPLESSSLAAQGIVTRWETLAYNNERKIENFSLIQNEILQGIYRRGEVNPTYEGHRISFLPPWIDYKRISWC